MGERKAPVLLRRSPVSDKIVVLTRYGRVKTSSDREILQAATDGKHDVTADFDYLLLEALLDPDSPDMAEILDGVADRIEITDDERAQVRAFRERLVEVIERHNERGHGASKRSST